MQIPWYMYLVGIIAALPVYILWAVGAYGIVRALVGWVVMPDTPKSTTPKVSLKG